MAIIIIASATSSASGDRSEKPSNAGHSTVYTPPVPTPIVQATAGVTHSSPEPAQRVTPSSRPTTRTHSRAATTRHHKPKPPPVVHSTSSAPTGCHPRTNGGNCYEPGEFCRNNDHGASGVAGDGEKIRCLDNNGWRWEPV